jgi:2-methylcitrate dehydratase PrpD
VALLGVEPGLAWFEPALYARPDVRALAARVHIEPQAFGGAGGSVRITADGRTRAVSVRLPRGSPALPLSEAEREMKYQRLLGDLMSSDRIRQTYADATALSPGLDARAFVSALPVVDIGARAPAPITT